MTAIDYYRTLMERFPCAGDKGCESIDADRLPAVVGMSGRALDSEPCDRCRTVDEHIARYRLETPPSRDTPR